MWCPPPPNTLEMSHQPRDVCARLCLQVGLVGYGLIGRTVHSLIDADPLNGIEVCFIHDAVPAALKDVDPALALHDLSKFDDFGADLVVEMAHPDVTRAWALKILEKTNYLFISVTAIADAELEAAIQETAMKNNTRAYVPHGGVVGKKGAGSLEPPAAVSVLCVWYALAGMDALLENRDIWESVQVVMKKPPANVDCANVGIDPATIKTETVLYDGPTRGICPKFPRNVNTHASIAYAGIGFDRTQVRLSTFAPAIF